VHDAVAHHPGAELDEGDGDEDGIGEDLENDLFGGILFVHIAAGGVAGVKVGESRAGGLFPQDKEVNDEKEAEEQSGDKKDPPGLIDAAGAVDGQQAAQSALHQRKLFGIGDGGVDDHLPPVEGEVEAERNEDAEDAAEGAALADVEPVGVGLDDGDGAEALEVHVGGIEE